MSFKYELSSELKITVSGEVGTVKSRVDYVGGQESQYWLLYKAADGRAVTNWWPESDLELVNK